MIGLITLIAIGLLGSVSQGARADTVEDELEQLVEYAPAPWVRSPHGPYLIAEPSALGFDVTGILVPGPHRNDVLYGEAEMAELRSHIILAIMPGFQARPGLSHPYYIGRPQEIDGFIEAGQAIGIWSFEETELSFAYEGRPDGLAGYGAVRVHFFNADRTTQCRGARSYLPDRDPAAFDYYENIPAVGCQVSRYAPDFHLLINVPSQFAMQLGDILTRVERDAEAIAAAAGLSGGEN